MKAPAALFLSVALLCSRAAAGELEVAGTRFQLDGKPFSFVGISFFNAIYNTNFNASSEPRVKWLKKFQSYGITVLRVWCQWDSKRGFVDASPTSTMYEPDGTLRNEPLRNLKAILKDADSLGMCVEIALFSHESYSENTRIGAPADEKAVSALAHELMPHRNAAFQIWNEHSDSRVLPLVRVIRSIDRKRLVTNSPGFAGVLGSDAENTALDYLTPHTTRHGKQPHWLVAPKELAGLLAKFKKPVVDDEPARNGTAKFGGPTDATSPYDHIIHIVQVWDAGAHPTYHHDMFQMGYGSPSVSPTGIPDPEFSSYHRQVFEFLKLKARYEPP